MSGRHRVGSLVAALGLLAVCSWLFWDGSSRRTAQADGAGAVQAARESIPVILSYQPETAEKDLPAAARDRLTGAFLDDYTQLITTVVIPDAKQKGVSASAQVPAAAVVSAASGHAVILAYVDQTLTVRGEPPTQTNTSVRVTMEKLDGRWMISGFDQEV